MLFENLRIFYLNKDILDNNKKLKNHIDIFLIKSWVGISFFFSFFSEELSYQIFSCRSQ